MAYPPDPVDAPVPPPGLKNDTYVAAALLTDNASYDDLADKFLFWSGVAVGLLAGVCVGVALCLGGVL